jgi:hypothetical protein
VQVMYAITMFMCAVSGVVTLTCGLNADPR